MCRARSERSLASIQNWYSRRIAQNFCRCIAVTLRGELDHRREERLAETAEVIAAIAVRHVTEMVDEPGELSSI